MEPLREVMASGPHLLRVLGRSKGLGGLAERVGNDTWGSSEVFDQALATADAQRLRTRTSVSTFLRRVPRSCRKQTRLCAQSFTILHNFLH